MTPSQPTPAAAGRPAVPLFEQLDFVYQPSRDVVADVAHYESALGAEVVFTVDRFATRVAMVRLTPRAPGLLLAEHLDGDQAILIFRVPDLAAAEQQLASQGCALGEPFEMPYGIGRQLQLPGPQRLAIYQLTEPERGRSVEGRRDF
jgi:hypothetical protein